MSEEKKEQIKHEILSCLYDHPNGADSVMLVNHLTDKKISMEDMDEHLQTVLQEQQSHNNLYLQGDASCWHLTARCRTQLEEELPAAERRVKATSEKPGMN